MEKENILNLDNPDEIKIVRANIFNNNVEELEDLKKIFLNPEKDSEEPILNVVDEANKCRNDYVHTELESDLLNSIN